jgi:hypothetical protein
MDNENKKRILEQLSLKTPDSSQVSPLAHQIPLVCEYAEFDGEDLTDCEQLLQTEKEFYIFKIRHEFRPEAERKGKWYFYIGICKKHFKQALASEQFTARSFNRTKKVRNPQKVEIANVWKVTAVRSSPPSRAVSPLTSKRKSDGVGANAPENLPVNEEASR